MTYDITAPKTLDASIKLPASKSISNRALIIYALSGGEHVPTNLSDCDDTAVVINALKSTDEVIDVKAAGTAMRFLSAYLSLTPGERVITGSERMKHRPIGILVDALRALGADIEYAGEEGFPPLRIKGHQLEGGQLEIPGNVSSQFISALLLIGPMLKNGLQLTLQGEIISRPYIDLTLWVMGNFGAQASWMDNTTIEVKPQPYVNKPYVIENDWSAASYWYEMVALFGDSMPEVRLNGLMDSSRQGDSIIKYIFSLLGVKTSFSTDPNTGETFTTLKHKIGGVQHLDFDFINCPDLAQTVVVTCCALGVSFHFTGLASLKIKETDRIEALKNELRKMGFLIRSVNDSELIWDHGRCEPTFDAIDTYEDHRMAMSFAPLAIVHPHLCVNHPEVVSKSYPHFWSDLRQAGFLIEEQQ